uniref:IstB_IS21 domain-containing protein n=1 Tax=Angiostrongylus cantonensis TaxID=6313 RepID=A0A0K0DPB4_ANGCA
MQRQQHVQCYDANTPLENVRKCIRNGHSVMVLMRGVPGSGKSHLFWIGRAATNRKLDILVLRPPVQRSRFFRHRLSNSTC